MPALECVECAVCGVCGVWVIGRSLLLCSQPPLWPVTGNISACCLPPGWVRAVEEEKKEERLPLTEADGINSTSNEVQMGWARRYHTACIAAAMLSVKGRKPGGRERGGREGGCRAGTTGSESHRL